MRAARLVAITIAVLVLPKCALADELLVSAAASLTDAFTEIGKAYSVANPATTVRFNFAASGPLKQQILQGAPVDVFASASSKEMDALQSANRLIAGTRADFASNRLVLIAPSGSWIRGWSDLRLPSVRHIAIGDPDSVPAGRYAKETLTSRGLWNVVQAKAVFGENVRQTLTYVSQGNADAGIVFATDQKEVAKRVRIVDTAVVGRDHEPIVYPAAAVSGAPNGPAARNFVRFLQNRAAQSILARYGFLPPVRRSVSPGRARPPAAHNRPR